MFFKLQIRLVCLIVSAICALIMPVCAQTGFVFEGKRTQETLAFKKSRGLIILPMYINGKGPFNFILDTGVGSVIITDSKLKDSLNLKYLRKIEIDGLGENTKLEAYSTPFLQLKVGNTIFKNASAAILNYDDFNLSGYFGMPIHGLLGYDFFNSFIVKVNYQTNILKIFTKRKPSLFKNGHKIPITLVDRKPFLDAIVETDKGEKLAVSLLIDCGSGHPLSLESFENKPFDLPNNFITSNLGVGLNGNIAGLTGRIKQLSIGKFNFDDMLSSFPYFEDVGAKVNQSNRNGSIGNPLLSKFIVVYDYQKKRIFLKPLSNFKKPFEYDKGGIELTAGGENFTRYLVSRVEPNSAAAEFGILPGDELLSVNFIKVSAMSMEEIMTILSSNDRKTIFVELNRGGDLIAGVLKLKKRI